MLCDKGFSVCRTAGSPGLAPAPFLFSHHTGAQRSPAPPFPAASEDAAPGSATTPANATAGARSGAAYADSGPAVKLSIIFHPAPPGRASEPARPGSPKYPAFTSVLDADAKKKGR